MPVPRLPPFPIFSRLVCINSREVKAAMARFFHSDISAFWRKCATPLLACVWMLGLVAGSAVFLSAGTVSASRMPWAFSSQVSIVGLLCVTGLPFLFSAFAVYVSHPGWMLPVVFLKAVSFASVSLGLLTGFGSAGWLMRLLLMFSDLCSLPLLMIFWIRYLPGERSLRFSGIAVFLFCALAIGSIDYCFVSPFLAAL